jgi:hypothetical protein
MGNGTGKKIFMKERHAHISFVGTGSAVYRGSPTCFTERRKAKNEVEDMLGCDR